VRENDQRDVIARDISEPKGQEGAGVPVESTVPPTTRLEELSGIIAMIGSATSSLASSLSSSLGMSILPIRADPRDRPVDSNSRELVGSGESSACTSRLNITIEPDFFDGLFGRIGRCTTSGASSADASQTTTLGQDVPYQVPLSLWCSD
jgi:hypothetical protein